MTLKEAASKIPIIGDVLLARWPQWREALKELFVILLFSLMPLWLGLLIVGLLSLPYDAFGFLGRFASSSDLGLISASLLGPLLYVILREQGSITGDKISTQFPNALWFVLVIFLCCLIATVIYNFTYVSGLHIFFNSKGQPINFVNVGFVTYVSIIIFSISIFLVLAVAVIKNTIATGSPGIMNRGGEDLADQLQKAMASEADNLTKGLEGGAT